MSQKSFLKAKEKFGKSSKWLNELEGSWEDFCQGDRVIVRTVNKKLKSVWRKGTVVEGMGQNERAIVVRCDERWHKHMDNYRGYGCTVMAYMNTRRRILKNIVHIFEPRDTVRANELFKKYGG